MQDKKASVSRGDLPTDIQVNSLYLVETRMTHSNLCSSDVSKESLRADEIIKKSRIKNHTDFLFAFQEPLNH